MSRFTDALLVTPLSDGNTWIIESDFGYDVGIEGSGITVNVPIGFMTDFASVPRIFWVIIPKWGKYGNAAVIHDWLYWSKNIMGKTITRKQADDIFREAMGILEVPKWEIFCMYWGVRVGGWKAWSDNIKKQQNGVIKVTTPGVQLKATTSVKMLKHQ